jgi:hypothetical protein
VTSRFLAALVVMSVLGPRPAAAQRTLDQALADPAVTSALATVEARRESTAAWLAEIGAIVSPSGREHDRARAVASEMRRIGLADVTVDAAPNVVGRESRPSRAIAWWGPAPIPRPRPLPWSRPPPRSSAAG